MSNIIPFKSIQRKIPTIENIDNSIVSNIYVESVKSVETNEYDLIMKLISQKKQDVFKLRDSLLIELMIKYKIESELLIELLWEHIDLEKGLLKTQEQIDVCLNEEIVGKFREYYSIRRKKNERVFTKKNDKFFTKQDLKKLYNSYKNKIKEMK